MREFHLGLYFEHLEDASFLYEQREVLLRDRAFPWKELQKFELRLEAHLDALVIGDSVAQEACAARLRDGDAGELFAALCVCCRRRDAVIFGELLHKLDFSDIGKVRAAAAALKREMPQEWQPSCERAIGQGNERWFPMLAEVCGYRRVPVGEKIAAGLNSCEQPWDVQVIRALARLPASRLGTSVLESCLREANDDELKAAALLALLLQGRRNELQPFYLLGHTEDWPQLALGLGGLRGAATVLFQRIEAGRATPATLLALGLLGDPSTVRSLCRCLEDETLAESAAMALYLITGAPLYEEAFEADTMVEAELFESELAAWKDNGELPKRSDGKPFGAVIRRLSSDTALWEGWLASNSQRFEAALRYRRGQLYSPQALLSSMLDESTSNYLRELANDELVIRYGCPVPFEVDWRVNDQMEALRSIARWVAANEAHFAPGQWS